MKRTLAIAVCMLTLTGCDGYLRLSGTVVRPDGTPVRNAAVYVYVNDKPDYFGPVLWTDVNGKFEIAHTDCPCDFPVEVIADHPDYGIGRYVSTHKALNKEMSKNGAAPKIVIRLTERPTLPDPIPAK